MKGLSVTDADYDDFYTCTKSKLTTLYFDNISSYMVCRI